MASEEAERSENNPVEGLVAELPEKYELVLGRHYAVWTDAKRYSGELRVMTPNELVLYESIRGWSVVYRNMISGYGPKDS
jgi:hypothetical protein